MIWASQQDGLPLKQLIILSMTPGSFYNQMKIRCKTRLHNINTFAKEAGRSVEKLPNVVPQKKEDRSQWLAKRLCEEALAKKGEDLVIIDVRERSTYADYILIVSVRSSRHAQGLADHVEDSLYQEGFRPRGIEGKTEGQWVLLDYGDVILHIFFEPVREVYDLEGLWMDAPRINPEQWGLSLPEEEHEKD